MRIALIAPLVTPIREPQRGGSQSVVADLALGLTKRGHDVHVYAASGSAIPGVTVMDTDVDSNALAELLYRADRPSAPELGVGEAAFATVYAAVAQVRYDVVHNHAFDPPAVRLAATLPSPVLHTLHLPPDAAMVTALDKAGRSENRPVVATVSRSQKIAWQARVRVDTVLPNGVPIDRIPWSAEADEHALFAGRLSPEKGVADAIRIAREAGLPIHLYGDPYDIDYAQALREAYRDDLGVCFHAGVGRTELWKVMSRARAVLCAAKWEEPFGMVAAEAQATGTPVIAYQRGALPEVVLDGRTGFVVPPDDVHAGAAALMRVGAIERAECRRHAARNLSLDASIAAHERLYARVTRSSPPPSPHPALPASGGWDLNG